MCTGERVVDGDQLFPVLCFSSLDRCSPLAAAAGLVFVPRVAVGCSYAGRRCLGERRQHAARAASR